MPSPVATSNFTSHAAVFHPTITPVTFSGHPTSPNVTFNSQPAVLLGDLSAWHNFHLGKINIWHPGFALASQVTKTVNGRPITRVRDPYQCFCGRCFILDSVAPNIIIGD